VNIRAPWLRILVPCTVLALAAVLGPVAPVGAADPAPGTTLTLSAPASGKAGLRVPFTATLTDEIDAPVAGVTVVIQRLGSTWVPVRSGTTDATGKLVLDVALPAGATRWRASYEGDSAHAGSLSPEVEVTGRRYATTMVLTGPTQIVDETTRSLSMTWTAADGSPVVGNVAVYRKPIGSGSWTVYRRLRTSSAGKASVAVKPRVDTAYRATGGPGSWWTSDTSAIHRIDNVPPIAPVSYPAAAPRPVSTPAQSRASGSGAHAVIRRISDAGWRSMVGRSWHRGCPVGRSGLRLLTINYWGFNGYRYRGQMVLSAAVASRAAAALRDMYTGRYPIRRMYRVDRFGWSEKLRGADDYRSMRADNTSAFNCRSVVNKPSVRSPHARGRAVDINTWENPYRSATGLVPNSWWASRSHPKIAWRSSSHPVVRIWRAHGFRWTYGTGDSQHVDGRRTPPAGSFVG
jgi:hypothetical protein